jgi:hypothetical protein
MSYFKEYGKEDIFTPEKVDIQTQGAPSNSTSLTNRLALESGLQETVSNSNAITGMALSLGVELGGGLLMSHKLNKAKNISRSLKALQVAKAVKTGSAAAVLAPDPVSTVIGIGGFIAAEAAIWGVSNLAGQAIRQSYGIQDGMSAGEAMAASVFGVGIVASKTTQVGQKIFGLTDGAGKLGAFKKTRAVGANMVSGAAIGVAESTMRQSIQIMLNERESYDKYDYLMSALIGGGANTLIGALTSTGAKGDEFIAEARDRSIESLKKQRDELIGQGKNKQARRTQEAIEVIEDFKNKLDAKNTNEQKISEKANFNQKDPRGAPEPVDDPVVTQPKEEQIEIPLEDTAKPDQNPLSNRRQKIEELREKFTNLSANGKSSKEIVEEVIPNFSREVAPLRDELQSEFNRKYKSLTRNLRKKKGEPILSEVEDLLETMDDLIAFNDVRLSVETGAGRALLGFQDGAKRYAFTGLSERAVREQELLLRMKDNMERLKQRRVLDDDLVNVKKKYDDTAQDVKSDFKERQEDFKPREAFASKTYKELQVLAKEKGIKANQKKETLIDELANRSQKVRDEKDITRIVTAKIQKLQKALDSERVKVSSLYGSPLNTEQAKKFAKQKEKALASNPLVQDLETRIKYYKDLSKQAELESKLKEELAQRAELEGKGTVRDLKEDIAKQKRKKDLDESPDKIKELRQKIADSKKRVRDRIKDIENAEGDMRYAELMRDLEDWHYRALDTEHGISWTKFGRGVREARRMALIDQLPSVLAGVPTGLGRLLVKDVVRPPVEWVFDAFVYGLPKANQMFVGNLKGTFQSLLNWDGTGTAFVRSFREAELVTTHAKSKFDERPDVRTPLRTLKDINAIKVRKYAENARKATSRVAQKAFDFSNWGDGFWAVMSLGVRGIGSVDEVFRRQVIRGRIDANARKRAIIAHPNNKKAQQKHYEEELKRTWTRDDGLEVLDDYRNHQNVLNSMNRDLFFAAQGDNLDDATFHKDMGEEMISAIKKVHNTDTGFGFAVDMFLPYVSVPIRSAYLGGKLALAPALAVRGLVFNPYSGKLKKAQKILTDNQVQLRKAEGDLEVSIKKYGKDNIEAKRIEKDIKRYKDESRQKAQELEIIKDRKMHYSYESMVDTTTGFALFGMGATMGANGMATGSLNFMTRDQQEKNGLRPFHGFGSDYVAAAPWALPFALGADLGLYQNIVNTEERYGVSIIKRGSTRLDAVIATINEITEQVPLFEGVETLTTIVKSSPEARSRQMIKLIQSYFPLPAFVRKVAKAMNDDETVADLKGGTFMQRQAYYFLGMKPVNVEMDYFGFPKQRPTERLQYLVMRQLPKKQLKLETEFDKIVASDLYDDLQAKPQSFYGVRLHDYITDEGVTLNTEFNRRLREFRHRSGGKKVTLKEAIERKISSRKWQNMYTGDDAVKYDEITGKYKNVALQELNKIIREFHRELAKELFADQQFTSQFVNKKEQRLSNLLEARETQLIQEGGNIQPLRELLKF